MKKWTWNFPSGRRTQPARAATGEEKGIARTAALAVLLLLITVLMFQLIDDNDRRERRRAREIRSQHARERMREDRARRADTLPAQPLPSDIGPGPPVGPPVHP